MYSFMTCMSYRNEPTRCEDEKPAEEAPSTPSTLIIAPPWSPAVEEVDPPCQEMEKVSDFYEESKLDVQKIAWARRGFFFVGVVFPNENYKEIIQTR